jgi:hypothetical protein
MATTVLFQTPQGGQNFNNLSTAADQVVTPANGVDISNVLNLRILFRAPAQRGLTFTVKIAAAATGTNSDVQHVLGTVAVLAGSVVTHSYPAVVARTLRVSVRLSSGSTTNVAGTCIVMGN